MGPRYLFLYGTLQPAAQTRMSRWLERRITHAQPASVPGRLVAIASRDGWFPALLPGRPFERCQGTLVSVRLAPGDLARLDRYEGREYRRVLARARLAHGHPRGLVTASVYLWRAVLPARSPTIRGGDFLAWLERTGRQSYTTARDRA